MRNTILSFLVIGIFMTSFFSCVSPKKIVYFKNIPDSIYKEPYAMQLNEFTDPKIQTNDLLSVNIQTLDPQTVNLNSIAQGNTVQANGSTSSGYLVDKNGFIDLPLVGKVQVMGLNLTDARALISRKASVYYKDPVVNVRFANFTVTVLGEVSTPRQISFPSEKVSILDAIAQAGDLTFTGRRDNVLIIREEDGQKKFVRLDLNNSDLFKSPYFYLKQRDVIYVEPNKGKIISSDAVFNRNIGLFSFALSTLGVVLGLYSFFKK